LYNAFVKDKKKQQKEQILANYREPDEGERCDLYVVLEADGEAIVRTTMMLMGETWQAFWSRIGDWSFVEFSWWAEDRGWSQERILEWCEADKPNAYWINAGTGALSLINEGEVFQNARDAQRMMYKQFVFTNLADDLARLHKHLDEAFESVHGGKLPPLLLQEDGQST
jgi:hypothetical protein